jgi:hypothetical protein
MLVQFKQEQYELVITQHAREQMEARSITQEAVIEVLETGEIKPKSANGKFWVYKNLKGRRDNLVSLSISIEKPKLVLITTLVNWRPR